jgi:uncharacterized membrane protein
MIGCIILGAFLGFMAVKLFAHRRACGAGAPWGWGGPWAGSGGHGRWHRHERGPWNVAGTGRGTWVWTALSRLDLSPAQERVVRAEVETLKQKAAGMRDEGAQSRADLARAVRGEDFEEDALASMFIRHDDRLHTLREDLGGALGRIHSVLDPAQRERLADMIEKGPGAAAWGGPYR